MGFFKRLFGICDTPEPQDGDCWQVDDGQVRLDTTRAPELADPGGALRLEGKGLAAPLLVMQAADGRMHAYTNKCSHGGRRLDPLDGGARLRCSSIGKATFELDGELVAGPAKGPIRPLVVEKADNELRITLAGLGD